MTLLFDQERLMEIHDHAMCREAMERGIEKQRIKTVRMLMKRYHLTEEEAQAAIDDFDDE